MDFGGGAVVDDEKSSLFELILFGTADVGA